MLLLQNLSINQDKHAPEWLSFYHVAVQRSVVWRYSIGIEDTQRKLEGTYKKEGHHSGYMCIWTQSVLI